MKEKNKGKGSVQNPPVSCLLVEGGGMKCAYSAGVLDAFSDEGLSFDFCVGVSAGVANLASFLAGQRDRNRRFYVRHSLDWRYFSVKSFLLTGSAFGLDYIYNDMSVAGGADALDVEAIQKGDCRLYFPVTNAATGEAEYLSDADMSATDLTAVCCTCALPVLCRPPRFRGQRYFDGGVADSLPIGLAEEKGAQKMVMIFSKPDDFMMEPQSHRAGYHLGLLAWPKTAAALDTRHVRYNTSMERILALRGEGKALTFAPSAAIRVKTTTIDPAIEQQLYENGFRDGLERAEEVRNFLEKPA